jgi:hemolysin III
MRGVSHQYAFFVSLGCGAGLILAASSGRARIAVTIYAVAVSALLGTSALYHRVTWRPPARRWMKRLDHSMIYVLLGLVSAAVFGELPAAIGWLGVAGLAAGGLLYVVGAVIYASGRPDPWPRVFGYHEVFHAFVLAAAGLQYAVIAFAVLPRA